MDKDRFPGDNPAIQGVSAVPPEVMTFRQGELLVSGTPVATDAVEQGIISTLAVYPWMRMSPAALRSFMVEVISPDVLPVIPGRTVIDKRVRQLANRVNEAAGVELIVVEFRGSTWNIPDFELRPGAEIDRPDRSYLYKSFVDASEIPELPKGVQRGEIPFRMCTNTEAVFNGRKVTIADDLLFLTNVFLRRRNHHSTSSQITAFRIPLPPGETEPITANDLRRLERRVNRAGQSALIITDGHRGGVRYMLNEAVDPIDLRHDLDAAQVALQSAQPRSIPARRVSSSPRRKQTAKTAERRRSYPMPEKDTYELVVRWSEALVKVSDVDVERTAAVYAEVDKETTRYALIVERLAEGLKLPLRPGDLPGMSTITQHYDTVVGIFDAAIKANYQYFADNPQDCNWNLALLGIYLGLPAQISPLSVPAMQELSRPSQTPTSYQALIAESTSAIGGREIAYIDRLCGLDRPIEPALKKCIALVQVHAKTILRELLS